MWGAEPSKQAHYSQGRNITSVHIDEIEGVCQCGYATLKPRSSFEDHNGGLTVKLDKIFLTDDEGNSVDLLKIGSFNRYIHCNACINNWM